MDEGGKVKITKFSHKMIENRKRLLYNESTEKTPIDLKMEFGETGGFHGKQKIT